MAKIFRFSGYLVENERLENLKQFTDRLDLLSWYTYGDVIQQLHIEESEEFEADGELEENCDLALLTRHFKVDNISTEFDRPLLQKGEKYKHFKLGKIVTVIGISKHTETEEISVVYEYEDISGIDLLKCL